MQRPIGSKPVYLGLTTNACLDFLVLAKGILIVLYKREGDLSSEQVGARTTAKAFGRRVF
jgi:hypothetical protein